MLQLLLSVALAPMVLMAEPTLSTGTQLHYRGWIEPTAADAPPGRKEFDLTYWVLATPEGNLEVAWILDERGNGAFPWPSRWGRTRLDESYRSATLAPALLYDRGDGQSVVPLTWPFWKSNEQLAAGSEFRRDELEFVVEKETKRGERAAWKVNVNDAYGPKRVIFVERTGPVVLQSEERLTMGRGIPYRLHWELAEQTELQPEALKSFMQALDAMEAMRAALNLSTQAEEHVWSPAQVQLLQEKLPTALAAAAGTPLASVAKTAQRDLELQVGRNDAVATMQASFVGKRIDDFQLRGTAGETLTQADLAGKVTVLHFWEYRDEPLREPYGQIGYLDFLHQRHKAAGLRLYGIAVNSRLATEATRAAAERSARKLKAFMNLSYPVMLDAGAFLRQFGDPRVIGASLPLFVVVGPEGTILHYHVGNYEVQRDQGLKELDDIVAELLRAS